MNFTALNLQQSFARTHSGAYSPSGLTHAAVHRAFSLYDRARRRGQLERLWAFLTRRPRALRDLAEACAGRHLEGCHAQGVQTVTIGKIHGSEGRSGGFTSRFYPIQTHTADRWRKVAMAWMAGQELPPVELIQVDGEYFVRDGHHRISVARALGQKTIEATVTICHVSQPASVGQVAPSPSHTPAIVT